MFFFTHLKLKKLSAFLPWSASVSFWVLKIFPLELKVVIYQKWVYFTFPLTDYKSKIIKLILKVTSDNTIKSEYFIRKLSQIRMKFDLCLNALFLIKNVKLRYFSKKFPGPLIFSPLYRPATRALCSVYTYASKSSTLTNVCNGST